MRSVQMERMAPRSRRTWSRGRRERREGRAAGSRRRMGGTAVRRRFGAGGADVLDGRISFEERLHGGGEPLSGCI